MIRTLTLNPSLDRTLEVPRLVPGSVHRASPLRLDLGGKGINVSRALRALGLASECVAFVGGNTGRALASGLTAEGYTLAYVGVEEETRQNITLLDAEAGVYTKINEPGPTVGAAQLDEMMALVAGRTQPGDLWALCGSLPPGVPVDYYASLIRLIRDHGALAFLDSSGPALARGLQAAPYAVKPNCEEAGELCGTPMDSAEQQVGSARALQARFGCDMVCLTAGASGLVMATPTAVVLARPPAVQARSPVGAGDAALAGLLWATVDGCDPHESARRAIACGTAAALQEGTGVGDRALVGELRTRVRVWDAV